MATLLPIMWKGSTVIAHMAKANAHWREIGPETRALLIVPGPGAYISPSWYASKTEHGRVVPTWNYTAVHLTGTLRVYQEPAWLRSAVADLTELHEHGREVPWSITDAPGDFIDTQLRAIVGIEMEVDHVDAKAKLSQNRSEADQQGVISGLQAQADPRSAAIAAAMQQP
jgi:transcriptional regulator